MDQIDCRNPTFCMKACTGPTKMQFAGKMCKLCKIFLAILSGITFTTILLGATSLLTTVTQT